MSKIKYDDNKLIIDLDPIEYFSIESIDDETTITIGRNITTTGLVDQLKRGNPKNYNSI